MGCSTRWLVSWVRRRGRSRRRGPDPGHGEAVAGGGADGPIESAAILALPAVGLVSLKAEDPEKTTDEEMTALPKNHLVRIEIHVRFQNQSLIFSATDLVNFLGCRHATFPGSRDLDESLERVRKIVAGLASGEGAGA